MKEKESSVLSDFTPDFTSGPSTLVYKTRADYFNRVPVLLSDDKTTIVSYPHPDDIKPSGKFSLPTRLNNNYLLDNRGIGANVAFLKLTYEEYAKLTSPLPLADLYKLIIDKDPLQELCNCGARTKYPEIVKQLNQSIDHGALRQKCKVIK